MLLSKLLYDVDKNKEYSPNKKRKISTVFDDMIADMHSKKKTKKINDGYKSKSWQLMIKLKKL